MVAEAGRPTSESSRSRKAAQVLRSALGRATTTRRKTTTTLASPGKRSSPRAIMSVDLVRSRTPLTSLVDCPDLSNTLTPPSVRVPYAQAKRRMRKQRLSLRSAVRARTSSLDRIEHCATSDGDDNARTAVPGPSSPYKPTESITRQLSRRLSNAFSPTPQPRSSVSASSISRSTEQRNDPFASPSSEWTTTPMTPTTSAGATFGFGHGAVIVSQCEDAMLPQQAQRRDSVESFQCRGLGVGNIETLLQSSQASLASPLSVSKQPLAPRPALARLYGDEDSESEDDDDRAAPGWAARRMNAVNSGIFRPQRPPRPDTLLIANSLARMEMSFCPYSNASPRLPSTSNLSTDAEGELYNGADFDSLTDTSAVMWSAPASPVDPSYSDDGHLAGTPQCLRILLDFATETIQPATPLPDDRSQRFTESLDELPRQLFVDTMDTVGELKDSLALALGRGTDFAVSRKDLIVSVRTAEPVSPVSPAFRVDSRRPSSADKAISSPAHSPVPSMARAKSSPASAVVLQQPTLLSTPPFASTIQHRRRASASPYLAASRSCAAPATALGLSLDETAESCNEGFASRPPLLTVSTTSPSTDSLAPHWVGLTSSPFTQRWRELDDNRPTILEDGLQDGDTLVVSVRRSIYTHF